MSLVSKKNKMMHNFELYTIFVSCFVAMSKRINLSKLAKKVEENKDKAAISSTKGVVINEKQVRRAK